MERVQDACTHVLSLWNDRIIPRYPFADGSRAAAVSSGPNRHSPGPLPPTSGPSCIQVGLQLSSYGSGGGRGNRAPRRPRGVTLKSREPTRTQTFHRDCGLGAGAPGPVTSVAFQEGGDYRDVAAGRAEATVLGTNEVWTQETAAEPERYKGG